MAKKKRPEKSDSSDAAGKDSPADAEVLPAGSQADDLKQHPKFSKFKKGDK